MSPFPGASKFQTESQSFWISGPLTPSIVFFKVPFCSRRMRSCQASQHLNVLKKTLSSRHVLPGRACTLGLIPSQHLEAATMQVLHLLSLTLEMHHRLTICISSSGLLASIPYRCTGVEDPPCNIKRLASLCPCGLLKPRSAKAQSAKKSSSRRTAPGPLARKQDGSNLARGGRWTLSDGAVQNLMSSLSSEIR